MSTAAWISCAYIGCENGGRSNDRDGEPHTADPSQELLPPHDLKGGTDD